MKIGNISHYIAVCFAVLALSACEKAPEQETEASDFVFKSDFAGGTLETVSGSIVIEHNGVMNHLDTFVEINGEPINETVEEYEYSQTPYRTIIPVSAVSHLLQNGENTLVIYDNITGLTREFNFFLDIVDPRIIIDKVELTDVPTNTQTLQSVRIEGIVSDLTPVTNIDVYCVDHFGATKEKKGIQPTGDSPFQRFSIDLPCYYPDRADPGYEEGSVVNPDDRFDSDIHWITTKPDFTFVITDANDNIFTINTVVPESRYKNLSQVQFNESLFANLTSYMNVAGSYVISQAESFDFFRFACLEGESSSALGESGNCAPVAKRQPGDTVVFRDTSTADPTMRKNLPSDIRLYTQGTSLDVNGFVRMSEGSDLCPTKVGGIDFFEAKAGVEQYCALYIRDVVIDDPKFSFEFVEGQTDEAARLDGVAAFNNLYVDVEIAVFSNPVNAIGFPWTPNGTGVDFPASATFDGSFSTRLSLDDSKLRVGLEIYAGREAQPNDSSDPDGQLFEFRRVSPVELKQPFDYGQPGVLGTKCDVCAINQSGIDIISAFYAISPFLPGAGDGFGSGVMRSIILALDEQIGPVVDMAMDSVSTIIPKSAVTNVDQSIGVECQDRLPDPNVTTKEQPCIDYTKPRRGIELDVFAKSAQTEYQPGLKWLTMLPGDIGDVAAFAARLSFDGQVRAKYDNTCSEPGSVAELLDANSQHIDEFGLDENGTPREALNCSETIAATSFGQVFSSIGEIQKDYVFRSKIDDGQIDFAFSLSTNFVNQYIQANHQTGAYEEYTSVVKASYFDELIYDSDGVLDDPIGLQSVIGTDPDEKFLVSYKTKSAPYVEAIPYQKRQFVTLCGAIRIGDIGLSTCEEGLFGPIKLVDVPEIQKQVNIIAEGVELTITRADGLEVFKADVDATIYTKPTRMGLEPMTRFADVIVQNVYTLSASNPGATPVDQVASAEAILSVVLEAYADDPDNSQLVKPPVLDFDSADLPKIYIGDSNGNSQCDPSESDCLEVPVSDSLVSILPIEFGVIFRAFDIDTGGDHFLFALDFVAKDLRDPDITGPNACDDDVPSDPRYVASLCMY